MAVANGAATLMTQADLICLRLRQQHLVRPQFTDAAHVVQWLGAVQSQDYAAAKWAVGQRVKGATDADVEEAFNAGRILRTHVLRPTWHFVAPADIRWMLELTAPRVKRQTRYYHARLGLDAKTLKRSATVIEQALHGGKHVTRAELAAALKKRGVLKGAAPIAVHALWQILVHVELDGLVCSGPRQGKQFTYALLDERVAGAPTLHREQALAALSLRYFRSHGPATVDDFVWWSGLTLRDARAGVAMNASSLESVTSDGRTYWLSADAASPRSPTLPALLLPNYDEYLVGYADRSALLDARFLKQLPASRSNVLFNHTIVVSGRVVGTWTRTQSARTVRVALDPFRRLRRDEAAAVRRAVQRFGDFTGTPRD